MRENEKNKLKSGIESEHYKTRLIRTQNEILIYLVRFSDFEFESDRILYEQ